MKRWLTTLVLFALLAAPAAAQPVLQQGSRGKAVRALQVRLGLPPDGIFGRATTRAVRRFQRRNGLPVTGRVDAATRAALKPPPAGDQGGLEATGDQSGGGGGVAPGAGEPGPAPDPGAAVLAMVEAARSAIGRPYKAASAGPDGFDCSGLIVWAAAQAGITGVPRSSFAQYEIGIAVDGDIQAGDLVFFDTAGPGPSDVGIASGPDTVISATTHGVREHPLAGPYWGDHFVGARRLD